MIPAPFDYVRAASLEEALGLLASHGEEARLLAGGQSLLPLMKLRLAGPSLLIDLGGIPGLNRIRQEGGQIVIGALSTHHQVESSALLKEKCPLLPQVASLIGDVQVRNRGTVGGSLAHADPAADLPAAMLALAAELKARGSRGERLLKAEDFFLGLMRTALEPGEILTEIHVPALTGQSGTAYVKVPQQASGFAVVGVAVWLEAEGAICKEVRVGVTGLASGPFRARGVEERLRGSKLVAGTVEEASSRVTEGVEPLGDFHASGEFRAHLARLSALRAIEQAAGGAGAGGKKER